MIPEAAYPALEARMRAMAEVFRLPLRNQAWRGLHGQWQGSGTGSSIDFQDHRPYFPGDDPRAIDWQVYARSGHYSLKLFREEVSPGIDLALDVSPSMFVTPQKAERTLELFAFALASARRQGMPRGYLVGGRGVTPLAAQATNGWAAVRDALEAAREEPAPPALEDIPWRSGALRVWITDLLYEGAPALTPLAAGRGRGVVLVPYGEEEAMPEWSGNLDLVDCESGRHRNQRVDPGLLDRYRQAYGRHFALWRDHARRLGIALARVACGPPFAEALNEEALPHGAVEIA